MTALRPPSCRLLLASPPSCKTYTRNFFVRTSLSRTFRARSVGRRTKNHLRQKLLKTFAPITADSPLGEECYSRHTPSVLSEKLVPMEEVNGKVKELVLNFERSESRITDNVDILTVRSFAGIFWGFIGIFIIHTALSVWIIGFLSGSKAPGFESESEGTGRSEVGGVRVEVDNSDSEMNDRILSIRRMAREAKANEKIKLENEKVDVDGTGKASPSANAILDVEKGVQRRMLKLTKKQPSPQCEAKQQNSSILIPNLTTNNPQVGDRKFDKRFKMNKGSRKSSIIGPKRGFGAVSPKLDTNHTLVQAKKTAEVLGNTYKCSQPKNELHLKLENNGNGSSAPMEKSLWWLKLPYVFVSTDLFEDFVSYFSKTQNLGPEAN